MYTGSSNHDEGRVRCKLSMFTFSTGSKFPKNPPWPPQVPLSLGNVRLPSSPSVHILRFSPFLPICCVDSIFLEGDTLKDDPVSFLIYLLWSSVTSHIWLFATPWTTACQASLSFTISRNLVKLVSIEYVMPSNHLICCFLLLLLPSIFPSIRVFSNESAVHIQVSSFHNSNQNKNNISICYLRVSILLECYVLYVIYSHLILQQEGNGFWEIMWLSSRSYRS